MDAHQQHIVHIATGMFGTFGVKAITMDDIASKCGISKKTLYQSFENKFELLQMVVTTMNNNVSQSLNDAHNSSTNAIDEIFQSLPIILNIYRSVNYRMIAELEKYHFDIWREVETFRQQSVKDFILNNLKRGQEDGHYHQYFDNNIIACLRLLQLTQLHTQAAYNTLQSDLHHMLAHLSLHYIAGLATAKGRAQLKKLHTKYNYDK